MLVIYNNLEVKIVVLSSNFSRGRYNHLLANTLKKLWLHLFSPPFCTCISRLLLSPKNSLNNLKNSDLIPLVYQSINTVLRRFVLSILDGQIGILSRQPFLSQNVTILREKAWQLWILQNYHIKIRGIFNKS